MASNSFAPWKRTSSPSCLIRVTNDLSSLILRNAASSFSTIAGGVPFGASTARHIVNVRSGRR